MSHPELVNPPHEVAQAYYDVVVACHNWQPTMVADNPPLPESPAFSPEASLCYHIIHPTADAWLSFDSGLLVMFLAIIFIRVTRIYRLPGLAWQLGRWFWLLAKSRVLSHDA